MAEGKMVRLEYSWQKRDKYGRLLAYVFLEGGTFLNAEIIRQGYGFAYTRYPFEHFSEFIGYEREARENSRGLWKHGELQGIFQNLCIIKADISAISGEVQYNIV